MPMLEVIKGMKEGPLVMMTRPDGSPADVPARLVGIYMKRGFKKGYKEPAAVTKRRAMNKLDRLKDQVAELEKLQKKAEKFA